jgi:hypothetical protein
MYDIFTDHNTHYGNLFVAVGNAELSNNMVSYTTDRKMFFMKSFYLQIFLMLLWRDNTFESFLFVLHHQDNYLLHR